MRSLITSVSLALALAAVTNAQTPAFRGTLNIQPGSNSGKCFTAGSNRIGAAVTIQACNGSDAQKWRFEGGSIKIFDDKCLDVAGGNSNDGTKLQVWTCQDKNENQQFFYNIWDNHISWTNKGKCLDLSAGDMTDGNRMQIWGCSGTPNQIWYVGYPSNQLPEKTQDGQYGTNACGTTSNQSSNCQTAWLNSVEDFCLWAPPNPDSNIGDTERYEVAWCTKSGRGTRTIPDGTLKGVHFVKTHDYVQITGTGDFTKLNIRKGDAGGELDPHGADGNGNPIGGLLYGSSFGNQLQYHEWTSFISEKEFCIRACVGPNAAKNCQHIYDVMGCYWNMPGNYDAGVFESCQGDNTEPMGVYGSSTWYQGVSPTPPPHPAGKSSSCQAIPTISVTPANAAMKHKRARLDQYY